VDHKDLDVWKKSIELVTEIYSITANFPNEEKYGIVSQIRRAAVSIPSNIAEGCARFSDKEILRFLDIARGSLSELETQLIISKNLGFIDSDNLIKKISPIAQMLSGLKRHLKQKEIDN
jgi:four helix bundle protein